MYGVMKRTKSSTKTTIAMNAASRTTKAMTAGTSPRNIRRGWRRYMAKPRPR